MGKKTKKSKGEPKDGPITSRVSFRDLVLIGCTCNIGCRTFFQPWIYVAQHFTTAIRARQGAKLV
uniref:Uncharacterized protein n=1 Tax=Triticum urartu TaxID=4572 RepID=A0A8R7UQJ9_TRIUA